VGERNEDNGEEEEAAVGDDSLIGFGGDSAHCSRCDFRLDMGQLSRLSIGGFFITMPAVFIGLLTLEWVFDLD